MVTSKAATSGRGLEDVPARAPLSAQYRTTFAYPTIKDRCPVILCKAIDHLHRERNVLGRELGEEAREGVKKVLEELSKLRYEMQTDKPLAALTDGRPSAAAWNSYLTVRLEENPRWFSSSWMWTECYMYRRMAQAIALAPPSLHGLDLFRQQKEEGFHSSQAAMLSLAAWLLAALAETEVASTWSVLLQVCLWGNKCDLSISAGSRRAASGDPVAALGQLAPRILADQGEEAWRDLQATSGATVDIVMDNSGFELFTDLCLADFLVTSGTATTVRLRIKDTPWFVSDTTPQDLTWTLERLAGSKEQALAEVGVRWGDHINRGRWTVHPDPFWTLPHTFPEMAATDPELYSTLAQASLVIFKGDLNYRKLVGDLNWETTAPFLTALQGFLPAPVLALRTAKADVMVGLAEGRAEETGAVDPDWMVNGEWGVMQYAAP